MKSLKQTIKKDLSRFGIESSKKELCPVCNYGTRITIVAHGKETSHCRYCNDVQLAKELDLPTSKEDAEKRKWQSKATYFSRMPDDLLSVKLNDYIAKTNEQKTAKTFAIEFITQFDKQKSLVLSGDPGIGKSHIAVSIAKALMTDYSVLFLKSTDLLGLIRESYNGAKHTEQDVFDICSKVDLLVLDDLGAEYDKSSNNESWASDIIYRVLDSRLDKSTIVTTNYNESGLREKFGLNGKRIVSRMHDKAKSIRITGKDMRKNETN